MVIPRTGLSEFIDSGSQFQNTFGRSRGVPGTVMDEFKYFVVFYEGGVTRRLISLPEVLEIWNPVWNLSMGGWSMMAF